MIENARVKGFAGLVILPDGTFVVDYHTRNLAYVTDHPDYFQRWQPRCRKEYWPGDYLSIVSKFCREHYHWIHDVLLHLHQVWAQLPESVRLIVPEGMTLSQRSLLEAIGVNKDRMVPLAAHVEVHVERLHFCPPIVPTRFDEPVSSDWLRDRLRGHFSPNAIRGDKKLYVSRRNAWARRVVNENDLQDVFQRCGVQVVCLEEFSQAEQAKLFAEATHVAGPHGAGLVNMYFAQPELQILELFNDPVGDRTHYWSMAEALGHSYEYAVGDTLSNPAVCEEYRSFATTQDIVLTAQNIVEIESFYRRPCGGN
ncbi:glycosyltransferase family 61 protein [Allorhodopirellula solitaria]|uniref:glycosyltransferase family 61 protein n=1 Tax=Allorhodopirellula solitaria TaxID=2527987 RepID=UPI0016473D5F|nr:glycosyltransferase family 61 protein [Allorhodopirellula solitaria]